FIAAFIVATSPIVVVHAHYFKEDMLQTVCISAALLLLIKCCERPTWIHGVGLGLCSGLAMSAKYPSILLLGLFIVAPVVAGRRKAWAYYGTLAVALTISANVFLLINWPLVDDLSRFQRGAAFELHHALTGHTLRTYAVAFGFSFHLFNSLVPGITWP